MRSIALVCGLVALAGCGPTDPGAAGAQDAAAPRDGGSIWDYPDALPLNDGGPCTDGRNYDIEQVRAGQLSLSATINEVVLESYCDPPIL
jgi:hypothetical protein